MSPREQLGALAHHLATEVVIQPRLGERLLVAFLADGHLLLETASLGTEVPAVECLAAAVGAAWHRIRCTPDLVPTDLTGGEIYRPEQASFRFRKGALFHNLLLVEEVERAPPKVQTALLEAMTEGKVTVGADSHPVPAPFFVLATRNPMPQAGLHALAPAHLDHFLLHLRLDPPDREASRRILARARAAAGGGAGAAARTPLLTQAGLTAARREIMGLPFASGVEDYLLGLVEATRSPAAWGSDLAGYLAWGAGPSGALALEQAARALAFLRGEDQVTAGAVQAIAPDALRHRLTLTAAAAADGMDADRLLDALLQVVPAP